MSPLALLALSIVADSPGSATAPEAAPVALQVLSETRGDFTLVRPAVVQDGMLLVIELQTRASCEAPALSWLDRRFRASPIGERHVALLPVPLGLVHAGETLTVRCGKAQARFSVPIVEGTYPESVLTVDPKFSSRPPARVKHEQADIDQAFRKSAQLRVWTESFVRPTPGIETSPFGVRRTFNGKMESRHRGVDFDGQEGDPIYAANDGTVVLAADDFYYTGNAVFIDHGEQLFTLYFHLSRADVRVGQRVSRGQLIGAIGKTGRVTGPHLHFAVKLAGSYVNPTDLLRIQPGLLMSEVAAVTGR